VSELEEKKLPPAQLRAALTVLLRATQEHVGEAQERLASVRLTRARLAARLADECDLTHEEIARLLPGLSRQRAGQLVAQGRVALAESGTD